MGWYEFIPVKGPFGFLMIKSLKGLIIYSGSAEGDIDVGNNWIVNLRQQHILHQHKELGWEFNLILSYSTGDPIAECPECDTEVPGNIRIIVDLQRIP